MVYKFVSNKDQKKKVKIGTLFPTLLERKKEEEEGGELC